MDFVDWSIEALLIWCDYFVHMFRGNYWLWWSVLGFISLTVSFNVDILQIFTLKMNPSLRLFFGLVSAPDSRVVPRFNDLIIILFALPSSQHCPLPFLLWDHASFSASVLSVHTWLLPFPSLTPGAVCLSHFIIASSFTTQLAELPLCKLLQHLQNGRPAESSHHSWHGWEMRGIVEERETGWQRNKEEGPEVRP